MLVLIKTDSQTGLDIGPGRGMSSSKVVHAQKLDREKLK